MNKRRIHILYEHGKDYRPFGSAFIRLIRPFSHPSLQKVFDVSFGTDIITGSFVDAVIIDRLWRTDVTIKLAERLVNNIRQSGAKIIYALDDNFHDILPHHDDQRIQIRLPIVDFFLSQADGVIVTTPSLMKAYAESSSNIVVLRHALDERLLIPRPSTFTFNRSPITIGYMGTMTHDDDLLMILPALKEVCINHPGELEVQIVGGIGNQDTRRQIDKLPIRYVFPTQTEHEYPLFMLWYTGQIDWDIAIAPLKDTNFNQSKSDIKFLDYCAIAAAGIFSRVAEYPTSVKHGENGWLVENSTDAWVEALETLFSDDQQRQTIASNAYAYLLSERILARRAGDWVEAVKRLLD